MKAGVTTIQDLIAAKLRLAGCVGFSLLAISCGATGPDASDLKHDADAPIRNSEVSNWALVSDAEYKTYISPLLGLGDNFLADSHEISVRSQFWVDAIDSNLRRRYPAKLANVPKPVARIISNPSVNAFIAPVPVCVNATVKLGSGTGSQVETIYFDQGSGGFGSWPAQYDCRDEGQTSTEVLSGLVKSFNAANRTNCKLTLTTERGVSTVAADSGCSRDSDVAGVGRAKRLAFMRTAAVVNIYTGLLTAMETEESFIGVIAHELGHYYRSHITTDDDFYGFFYEMSEHNDDHRPVRGNAAIQALGQKAQLASRAIGGTSSYFKSVSAQKFSSKVYLGIGSFAQDTCAAGTCPAACTELVTFMSGEAHQSATAMFPFRDLSAAGRQSYATFETKATACLGAVAMSTTTWDKLLRKVAVPTWPAWIDRGNYRETINKIQGGIIQFLPRSTPAGTSTVADAFAAMTKDLNAVEARSIIDLKTAFDKRIGQYTAEQEADDASAEWLTHLHIDPKFAGDTQMDLGKWIASKGADKSMPLDIGYVECERVRKNGWRREDGAYQYIAIGDYDEVHHGFCYRAFNVDREIKAHSYRVDPAGARPQPGGPSWARLKELAEQATEAAAPAPIDNSAAAILRKLQGRQCPLAPVLVRK